MPDKNAQTQSSPKPAAKTIIDGKMIKGGVNPQKPSSPPPQKVGQGKKK